MSFRSGRVLDGYALDPSNNAFVTKWLDVHSSPYTSIKCVFSSNSADGYLSVEESDDVEAIWTTGETYPASAQFTGAFGTGPMGDAIDTSPAQGIMNPVAGNALPYTFTTGVESARFIRLKFIPNTSHAMNVTVTWSRKSSS